MGQDVLKITSTGPNIGQRGSKIAAPLVKLLLPVLLLHSPLLLLLLLPRSCNRMGAPQSYAQGANQFRLGDFNVESITHQ